MLESALVGGGGGGGESQGTRLPLAKAVSECCREDEACMYMYICLSYGHFSTILCIHYVHCIYCNMHMCI